MPPAPRRRAGPYQPVSVYRTRRRRFPLVSVVVVVVVLGVVVAALSSGGTSFKAGGALLGTPVLFRVPPGQARAASADKPNIVFVLTDDLSLDLLRYMPHVLAMEHNGLTFKNYFVSDSLCCPS